jgi:tRNA A37 threonylcarbamoyladenosine modification protein TsaB
VLVSSLDALAADLAAASQAPTLLLPCLDAGKGQVYARLYDWRQAGDAPQARAEADWVLAPADLAQLAAEAGAGQSLVAGGTGVDRYADELRTTLGETALRVGVPGPGAVAVARLAWARLDRGEQDDIATAVPRYGRPPDITRPKRPPVAP